jgi:hypothetical protein
MFSQQATVQGIVLNEEQQPVSNVNISIGSTGTQTNQNGFYKLSIPVKVATTLTFTHVSYKKVQLTLQLSPNEQFEFNPILKINVEQIDEVTVLANKNKVVSGITNISPKDIRLIPGANAGVENLLKSLPGVNSNNELSTQYSVRGGNYDENLVYVNEIEVYRPFLIRSGQQEGLSFVNTDLIQNVDFSAGGFQAKYGDKLSSVLDITYKNPVAFGGSFNASLLGASASVETSSGNSKFSTISGVRYRNNSLLVNSKQTEANFSPTFADAQTYLTYKFSEDFQLSFLGNLSLNNYDYKPTIRQTNFGSLLNPTALFINYEGEEKDSYKTALGALKATLFVNNAFTLKFITSVYHTSEEENYDILARYELGEINTDFSSENLGDAEITQGIGSQYNHGRNHLDALISNIEHKGSYQKNNHQIDWGVKFTHEDIRDRIVEWEVIDSTGFSVRPPLPDFINNQPYEPFVGPLTPYQNIRATNHTKINRLSGYSQWSKRTVANNHELWFNAGIRFQHWQVSGKNIDKSQQTTISPRAQFAIKPNWKKEMVFRVSGGWYHQPPFYRELRDSTGTVQPNIKAQQSIHLVAGNDYSFKLWNRPFKLITEAYYKKLTNVNPYTLENVRIRYQANNNANAFAYGLDMRLYGEFVPGTESWVSFGYLKTEENINNQGYIARPTDQRLKMAVLFQDYVPNIPELRMYLNMVYNTGLPGGSPSYANPYDYQRRLKDYKRADLGISYVFTDYKKRYPKGHWLHKFKELSAGFEIFNIFDVQNAITNTWVRDVYTKRQFGVPNYMTGRVFNLKLSVQF